jgi:predicted RNase H-like HicB family nuclease
MHNYKIEIQREGKWWMVYIPDIEGVTQARRLTEASAMAREYIALDQNIPVDDIKIETASIRMQQPEFAELLEKATDIRTRREDIQKLEAQVQQDTYQFCHWLVTYGVPVRDIAELLDISPQRVSQLANS